MTPYAKDVCVSFTRAVIHVGRERNVNPTRTPARRRKWRRRGRVSALFRSLPPASVTSLTTICNRYPTGLRSREIREGIGSTRPKSAASTRSRVNRDNEPHLRIRLALRSRSKGEIEVRARIESFDERARTELRRP